MDGLWLTGLAASIPTDGTSWSIKALVSVSHQRLSIGKGKKDQSQACPRHLKGKAVFIRPELEFSQWRDVQVKIGLRRQ
jgi:hypothetical protein